jgi:hypothetical protein
VGKEAKKSPTSPGLVSPEVYVFRHLFVCFQTSVYTLGEFHKNRNNSTVFEELSVSIVDLTVANIRRQ